MATTCTEHAMSAFTHSLLSTPRNPLTRLPSDRAEREGRLTRVEGAGKKKRRELLSSSLTLSPGPDSRPSVAISTARLSWQGTESGRDEPTRPRTAPPMAPPSGRVLAEYVEAKGNLRSPVELEQDGGGGAVDPDALAHADLHTPALSSVDSPAAPALDYPTLFATMLESNALLRDEINDLRHRHAGTVHVVERLQREGLKDKATELTSNYDRGSHFGRGSSGLMVKTQDDADTPIAANAPTTYPHIYQQSDQSPRLPPTLQDTWMQTDPPLCQDHERRGSDRPTPVDPIFPSHPHTPPTAEPLGDGTTAVRETHLPEAAGSGLHELVREDASDIELQSVSNARGVVSGEASPPHSTWSGSTRDEEVAEDSQSSLMESLAGDSDASVEGDPFAPPGVHIVGRMWDDFSVEDYAPAEYSPDVVSGTRKEKEWTPRITIPEPFSMSLREGKSPKRKSRSWLIVERERMEAEAKEKAEMQKQFRATPIPASTFLPLYELVNTQNEQRRLEAKQRTREILHSTERPFSFTRREEERRRFAEESLRQRARLEVARTREEHQFRAKPFPSELFDSRVDEELKEKEEYRRIRIKMRAQELLASSRLPGNMQVKGTDYTIGSLRRDHLADKHSQAFLTDEHKFQPRISSHVPDHDRAYEAFQWQLEERRAAQKTTSPEPFNLRTQLIPSRRSRVEEDMRRDEEVLLETRWPFVSKRTKLPRQTSAQVGASKDKSSPYPVQMTETARLRTSLTQEKLAEAVQREREKEEEAREKRERERSMQRVVSQKSFSHDPTARLEESKRQKLHEFRRQDKEQQAQYHRQLEQMRQRVEARPLLLEKPALDAAHRSAEARYEAALKSAGLSEEDIRALSSSDRDGEK